MIWWILGAVAVGGGVLLLANKRGNGTFNRGFGMAMYGDPINGAQQSASYGMAFYGGFSDMQQAPRGIWTPSLGEGQ